MSKKKINLAKVAIEKSQNENFPGKDVVVLTWGKSFMGTSGQHGFMYGYNSGPAYNDFNDSAEWKALNPRVLMLLGTSDHIELSSNTLKPNEIIALLQQTFEAPVLDAFVDAQKIQESSKVQEAKESFQPS